EGEGAEEQLLLLSRKWKKFWGVLYRESSCSTARLELLEASGAEKPRRTDGGRGRLVRLSDCVHVAETGGDTACPKDTVPFVLETTDRRFLLAADSAEAAEWIQRLSENPQTPTIPPQNPRIFTIFPSLSRNSWKLGFSALSTFLKKWFL
uniref:Uncharacterized protein n=1 Tax=Malurus cyaneus samueli TaxID=2593467 RepID=A0A8C5TIE3_9PASS